MADQQWIIDLKLQNEQAKKQAEELGDRLEAIEEEPVEVDADTTKAQAEIGKVEERSAETRNVIEDVVRQFEEWTGIDLGPLADTISGLPTKLLGVVGAVGLVIGAVFKLRSEQEKYNELIDETAERWEGVFQKTSAQDAALEFASEFTDELRTLGREGITSAEALEMIVTETGDVSGLSVEAAGAVAVLTEAFHQQRREQDFVSRTAERLEDDFLQMGYAAEEGAGDVVSSQGLVQDSIDESLRKIERFGPTMGEEVDEMVSDLDRLKGELNVQLEAARFEEDLTTAFEKVRDGERLTREETIQLAQDFLDLAEVQGNIPEEVQTDIVSNILDQTANFQSYLALLRASDGLTTQQIVQIVYQSKGPSTYVPPAYGGPVQEGRPANARSAPVINTQVTGAQLERTLDNWNRVNGYG